MFCKKCGVPYSEKSNFCTKCGEPLNRIQNAGNQQQHKQSKKWYENTAIIILLLIFFFPLGLFLMWKYSKWNNALKAVISILVGIAFIGIAFIGIIFIANLGGHANNDVSQTASSSKTTEKQGEIIIITSSELAKAYEENNVNAKKLYKEKMAEITGEVMSKGEVLGETYITLNGKEDSSMIRIQCFFDDEKEKGKVAEISEGDTVTVIGQVKGQTLNISVYDCKFK